MRGLFNPSLCIPVVVYQDGGDNVTGNGVRGNGVRRLGLSVAAGIRPQRSGGRSPVPTGVGGVLASATQLRHVRASDRANVFKAVCRKSGRVSRVGRSL